MTLIYFIFLFGYKERFVESSNDPVLSVDAQEYGECVQQEVPGLSFNVKGKSFTSLYVSAS